MFAHLGSAHIDPVDDDTPASNSHTAKATTFAEAIGKVLKTNNSSKPKLWEPDPLMVLTLHKLCTFILQCKLNFRDHKDMFEDNTNKVNYALSYLKGTALDFLNLLSWIPSNPNGFQISTFSIKELKENLGTYDPVSEAEAELEGLRMHESHQAIKYFIKFQQLATCVQWVMLHPSSGLQWTHQMYQGQYGPPR